jgi:hypothetical protein
VGADTGNPRLLEAFASGILLLFRRLNAEHFSVCFCILDGCLLTSIELAFVGNGLASLFYCNVLIPDYALLPFQLLLSE